MAPEVESKATSEATEDLSPIGWRTVLIGSLLGGSVIIVGSALAATVTDEPLSSGPWLYLLVATAGFALAGWWGGRRRGDSPMLHGALAGLGACALAQTVGVVGRLVGDEAIDVVALALTAVVAAVTAVGAALVADWHRRNRSPQPRAGGVPLGSGESAG